MRKIILLFLAFTLVLGITGTYFYWPNIKHKYKKTVRNDVTMGQDLEKARTLLNQSKPEEALAIIKEYGDAIDNKTEMGKQWLDLLIRASESTLNFSQLLVLYDYYPQAFDSHEKASMIVGEIYINTGKFKEYQNLRDSWKGRETTPETWFVLDADKLFLEGKRKEAIDFLNSKTFPGKADTSRLVRLALMYSYDDPNKAWDYLNQAYQKDPTNPEIRSYRAKLLETYGKNNLALIEYIAAIQTDPKNVYLRDQLAEFYLRQKEYPQALMVWLESLKAPSLDEIWIKAFFWGRMVIPVNIDWHAEKIPDGRYAPLAIYLIDLKPDQYWNEKAFEQLADANTYLKTIQMTFWLRLVDALQHGDEKEAADLLKYNPFSTVSWNAELETALTRILQYRKTGRFTPEAADQVVTFEDNKTTPAPAAPAAKEKKASHLLFSQLDDLANQKGEVTVSPDLEALLKGPEAFTAAFLASGWNEAALALHHLAVLPDNYPSWVAVLITQAYRLNKSNELALKFALAQKETPGLSLIIGELLIANKDLDAALERLTKLTKVEGEVGYRASWLVGLIYIDKGQYEQARTTIDAQPTLSKDMLGKEMMARIALLEGNTALADTIYNSIESTSSEAKSYLARKAFEQKDWKKARELTEQLLRDYPTNPLLQQNLTKIIEEQSKTETK